MARYKRRKFLVNKAQYRLLAFNLLYFLLFMGSVSAVLWIPLVLDLQSSTTTPAARAEAARLFLYLHARILPVGLVLAVVSTLHSILVSHRIVGPLVRFKYVFERLAEGRLGEQIHLRDRDYLHEEAETLNQMTRQLASRVEHVDDLFAELHREWRAVRREMQGAEPAALTESLPRLEQGFADCARALGTFDFGTPHSGDLALDAQPAIRSSQGTASQGTEPAAALEHASDEASAGAQSP
jgi:methyl-accepting chemotaxis protein